MAFLDKVKSSLGIGGVKVDIITPPFISKTERLVEGKVVLKAKKDEKIKEVVVKLVEEWTTGRGNDKKTQDYEMGKVEFSEPFTLAAGETKEVPFKFNFIMYK